MAYIDLGYLFPSLCPISFPLPLPLCVYVGPSDPCLGFHVVALSSLFLFLWGPFSDFPSLVSFLTKNLHIRRRSLLLQYPQPR